jgi:amino acid transporter
MYIYYVWIFSKPTYNIVSLIFLLYYIKHYIFCYIIVNIILFLYSVERYFISSGSSFSTLLDYFGPASWFFYALSSSALIKLRYTEPNTFRPYKIPYYPIPPLIVIFIAIMVIVSSFINQPLYCFLAFSFIFLSIPVHYIIRKYYTKNVHILDEYSWFLDFWLQMCI